MTPISLYKAELMGAALAWRRLRAELGFGATAKLMAALAADQALGRPWRELGPPADAQDRLSRRQIGSAVLLERRLRDKVGPERARSITAGIVRSASVQFLRANVPPLRRAALLAMPPEERQAYVAGIQRKFFNADAEFTVLGDEALLLTVSRCRFPELLAALGESDMASIFCEGDRDFFDKLQPEVVLDRPRTIAEGREICEFRFQWKSPGEATS